MDNLTSSTSSGVLWFPAIAAVLLTTAVITALRKRDSRKPCESAPPVLHGAALVRFVRAIARDGPLEAIREQQAKLGSVFTASLPGGLFNLTFLIGPEVSSHFYVAPESKISSGRIYEFTVPMFGPEVGHGVDLDTRNEQIHFGWDVLKPNSMKACIGAMAKEAEDYFSRWGEQGTVDLKHELQQVLMFIAGRCLLGREVRVSMLDEVCALSRDLDDGMHLISMLLPYLPIPAHRRRDRAHRRLKDIFLQVIRSRRNSSHAGAGENNDVLQHLIDSRYKDGRAMTDAEVAGMILTLMFAGKHTSSIASTWTGIHLLSHPNQLAAAIDEQEKVMARHHGANHHRIDYDVVQEMRTLHFCIKEAVRLHPMVVALARHALTNFTVQTKEGERYTIPGGHMVTSPILVNNHLPHVYKDPLVFDPQRFAPGREEDKVAGPFTYLTFGARRHACPGEYFAYTNIKVIWSHLLRNFELKMVSPFPETKWSTVIPEPKGKVMVSYRRQQHIY